jgi:hypothetical protein
MSALVHVPVGYVAAALADGDGVGDGESDGVDEALAVGAGAPLTVAVGVGGVAGPQAVRSRTAPTAAIRGSRFIMPQQY